MSRKGVIFHFFLSEPTIFTDTKDSYFRKFSEVNVKMSVFSR